MFSDSDSESAKAFLFIASNDEINTYAFTTSSTIKNKLKIDKDTVVVLKSFDEGRVDHVVGDNKLVIEDVMDFVVSNSIPLVQGRSYYKTLTITIANLVLCNNYNINYN